jgi:molybdopterin-guanine dinucleotide biosynthesis protein A
VHHAELTRAAFAVAVACDMPFVSSALLQRLVATSEALVVAPRRAGRWEPLCARYHAGVASLGERRVAMGDYSLQRWLDEAAAVELPLEADEADQLCDWDTPEDMAPGHCAERAR